MLEGTSIEPQMTGKLLVEAYNGSSKEPRNSGMRLFGIITHLKAAVYMGELKKSHTGPVKIHVHEKREEILACT